MPKLPRLLAEKLSNLSKIPPECLDELGRNGKKIYTEHLSFKVGVDKFDQYLERLSNNK